MVTVNKYSHAILNSKLFDFCVTCDSFIECKDGVFMICSNGFLIHVVGCQRRKAFRSIPAFFLHVPAKIPVLLFGDNCGVLYLCGSKKCLKRCLKRKKRMIFKKE